MVLIAYYAAAWAAEDPGGVSSGWLQLGKLFGLADVGVAVRMDAVLFV